MQEIQGSGYIQFVRWTWFWDDRIDEDGSYETAIQKMYDFNEEMLNCNEKVINPDFMSEWKSLGPDVNTDSVKATMGLVQSLWIDTTGFLKMYAGSNTRGLFITTDAGENWSPLMNNIGGVGVNEIMVHPESPDTIYIATGIRSLGDHYGHGIMKSTDGGVTWQNTGLNPGSTSKMIVNTRLIEHPDSAYCMYALGNRTGNLETYVYKTYNGFQTYDTVFSSMHNELFDIELKPGDPSTVYVSGSLVCRSTDYGMSWNTLTGNLDLGDNEFISRAEMAVTDANPDVLMVLAETIDTTNINYPVYDRRLYKSNNNGDDFCEIRDTIDPNDYYGVGYWKMELKISQQDTNQIYLGGLWVYKYAIYDTVSTRLKNETSQPYHIDIRDMHLFQGEEDDIIYIGNDGGVTRSFDGGLNWEDISRQGLQITQYYKFGLDDRSPVLLGGTQDGNKDIYNYNDNEWTTQFGLDGGETIIDYENPSIIYTALFAPYKLMKSTDGGNTFTELIKYSSLDHVYSNVNPFIIDLLDHNTLYLGLHDIYKTADGGSNWDTISDFTNQLRAVPGQTLRAIGISRSDTDILYAGYRNPIWNLNGEDTIRLMSTMDGGKEWEDITDKALYQWEGISDIEVSPSDASRFWVSLANHSSTRRIYQYDQYGDVMTNISDSLPDLPVNCLKYYEHGDMDELFAGTDAGVYYWNDTLGYWIPCNDGMPLCMVTDLEINYKTNKLVASTFGRGMYEVDLEPCDNSEQIIITSDTTWTKATRICRDIIIMPGSTLTVKGRVYILAGDVKITVRKGGKLVVDGGVIESGYNGLWNGIEVLGDPSLAQNPVNQGSIAVINNGIITDARTGIRAGQTPPIEGSYTMTNGGGIVVANNAQFWNNNTTVFFEPYSQNNISQFINTQFTINNQHSEDFEPVCFLDLMSVKAISIKGSVFSNTVDTVIMPFNSRGNGIHGFNSGFTVEKYINSSPPFDTVQSSFNGLDYGIRAFATTTSRTVTVDSCIFSGNKCGIYLNGFYIPTVIRNFFQLSGGDTLMCSDTTCGIYLDVCTGYQVEENIVYGLYTGPAEWKGIGIVVNNSGSQPNEIYNNCFEDCFAGIIAQNINRGGDTTGLEIICNDYINCEYDIAITADSTGQNIGIKRNQGSGDADPAAPANNTFSYSWQHNTSDYHNDCEDIIYWHLKDTITANTKPKYHSVPEVNPQYNNDYYYEYDKQDCCPPDTSNGGGVEGLKNSMIEAELSADSTQNLLNILEDGGDTQALKNEVETAFPDDALILKEDLLNDSPYLSDTVMVSVTIKEDVLTSEMATEILSSNPQAAKSDTVQNSLDSRTIQLTEEQRIEIDQGWFITSAKESLEARLSNFKSQRTKALNHIIRLYRNDSCNFSVQDSIILYLENENSLWAKYVLAFEYLEKKDSANVINTLDEIITFFNLSYLEFAQHQLNEDLLGILLDLQINDKNIFEIDSISKVKLYNIYNEATGALKTRVRNILIQLDTLTYNESYIFPDYLKKGKVKRIPVKRIYQTTYFELYPNPAGDFVVIDYSSPSDFLNATIQFYDNQGRLFKRIILDNKHDYIVYSLKDFINGVYICRFFVNNKIIESKKLVVIN